ncbi:hypothetical protein [Sorangium sp. So ce1151]|uniref:hypothetical protein n=1 Tax=Sorangium sp. So ce1151 TaxID=3133332 RepID=UPI003F6189D5
MSESELCSYAWCDEVERIEAFAAALSALVIPGALISLMMSSEKGCKTHSIDAVLAMIRAQLGGWNNAHILSGVMLDDSERAVVFGLKRYTDESGRRRPWGPLRLDSGERTWDFFPYEIAVGSGPRSVEAEAAVACHLVQGDIEDLLLRL